MYGILLAGASLELSVARDIGLVGTAYVVCRIVGKFLGARMGSQFSGADQTMKTWMGVALLPQAGVTIGMALVASSYFPEYRLIEVAKNRLTTLEIKLREIP